MISLKCQLVFRQFFPLSLSLTRSHILLSFSLFLKKVHVMHERRAKMTVFVLGEKRKVTLTERKANDFRFETSRRAHPRMELIEARKRRQREIVAIGCQFELGANLIHFDTFVSLFFSVSLVLLDSFPSICCGNFCNLQMLLSHFPHFRQFNAINRLHTARFYSVSFVEH